MFRRLLVSVASVSLVASALAPVAFADDNTIQGNGPGSNNTIVSTTTNTTTVEQGNETGVENTTIVVQNTGLNESSSNSGNSSIDTGNTTSNVTNTTGGSSNIADVPPCCPDGGDNKIKDNGPGSKNTIIDTDTNTTTVGQGNLTLVSNKTLVVQNTGLNTSKKNQGNSTIVTGNTTSNVTNTTGGSSNIADVPPCCPDGGDNKIKNNGPGSKNTIIDTDTNTTAVGQGNLTLVSNKTLVVQNTGLNTSKKNQGNSSIVTGNTTSNVTNTTGGSVNVLP